MEKDEKMNNYSLKDADFTKLANSCSPEDFSKNLTEQLGKYSVNEKGINFPDCKPVTFIYLPENDRYLLQQAVADEDFISYELISQSDKQIAYNDVNYVYIHKYDIIKKLLVLKNLLTAFIL